jgi:peptide chain release factor subunit 1
MPFTRELRELESVTPTYPFLSVYLDVGHNDASSEAMRVFVRTKLRQAQAEAQGARERTLLETDGRHVLAYLEDVIHARVERKSQGLALFACARQKFFQVVGSPMPFESRFVVADRPFLEPLRAEQNAQRVLACLVDSRSARIQEIGAGTVQAQAEIQNEVPRRHHAGGWSQMRFQRHVDDHIDHHHREVAVALTHLSDREPQLPVVLGGPETVVRGFQALLPERVQSRVVADLPVALKSHEREIVTRVIDGFEAEEEERLDRELERQIEEALSPVRGARGTDEVLHAANTHAIRRLFVSSGFDAWGWRCRGCGSLGTNIPLSCPFCSEVVESKDVRPELIHKVLASGGEVSALPASRDLQHGVVALLRHRV